MNKTLKFQLRAAIKTFTQNSRSFDVALFRQSAVTNRVYATNSYRSYSHLMSQNQQRRQPQAQPDEYKDDDGNIISKNAWKKLQKIKAAEAKRAAKESKQSGNKKNE